MKGISTRAVDDLDQWMGASYGKKREAGRIVSVRLRSSPLLYCGDREGPASEGRAGHPCLSSTQWAMADKGFFLPPCTGTWQPALG